VHMLTLHAKGIGILILFLGGGRANAMGMVHEWVMLHLNGDEPGWQVNHPGGAVVLGPVGPCACHPR